MFSDDESDLTDISSEEDYVPLANSTKNRKPAQKVKQEYVLQHALRPARQTQYNVGLLYDQIIEGSINLNPEYQRDVVWPECKQVGLIDSLLRNYYVPPVIFAVSSQDDGTETRVCIDGKQRLTSIQRFMDGLIPYKDSHTSEKLFYKQVGKTRKRILPKAYLHAFAKKQITCMEYDSLTDDQEREIFQRVQLGVALTPAERMQAITGPWPSFVRDLQKQVLGPDGFGNNLEWRSERGRDFQCITSILWMINEKTPSNTPSATQLPKFLEQTQDVPARLRSEIQDAFRIYTALAADNRYNHVLQKPTRISPVEFTMIGFLIFAYRTTLSMCQLSSAIAKMRVDVRAKHADVRGNTKVSRTMLAFIHKKLKGIIGELAGDGKGDISAAQALPSKTAKKPTKRKRVEDSEDEDNGNTQPQRARQKGQKIAKTNGKQSQTAVRSQKASGSATPCPATTQVKPSPSFPSMGRIPKKKKAPNRQSSSSTSTTKSPTLPAPEASKPLPELTSSPRQSEAAPAEATKVSSMSHTAATPQRQPSSASSSRSTPLASRRTLATTIKTVDVTPSIKSEMTSPVCPSLVPPPALMERSSIPPPPRASSESTNADVKPEFRGSPISVPTPGGTGPWDRLAPIRAARAATGSVPRDSPAGSRSLTPAHAQGTFIAGQAISQQTQDPRRASTWPVVGNGNSATHNPAIQQTMPQTPLENSNAGLGNFFSGISIQESDIQKILASAGFGINEPGKAAAVLTTPGYSAQPTNMVGNGSFSDNMGSPQMNGTVTMSVVPQFLQHPPNTVPFDPVVRNQNQNQSPASIPYSPVVPGPLQAQISQLANDKATETSTAPPQNHPISDLRTVPTEPRALAAASQSQSYGPPRSTSSSTCSRGYPRPSRTSSPTGSFEDDRERSRKRSRRDYDYDHPDYDYPRDRYGRDYRYSWRERSGHRYETDRERGRGKDKERERRPGRGSSTGSGRFSSLRS